jgi:uncharacterized protein YndB with AHSA1/START domain
MYISRSIHIDAPPERVWQATVDVERWPSFAAQFQRIVRSDDGPLALGKKARATPRGLLGSEWVVIEYEEGRSFTWETDALPGLHLVGGHVVEPEGDGTRATASLRSSGPVALLITPVAAIIFRRNTRLYCEGLKKYCEGGAT